MITDMLRIALRRVLGRAGYDAHTRKYDIAIGERNEYLRQRDIAIGERNEFLRQRDDLLAEGTALRARLSPGAAMTPDNLRKLTYPKAMIDLVAACDCAVSLSSEEFFAAIDQARERFRDVVLAQSDGLEDALLGLKLINLMIAKHEYLHGRIAMTARPVGMMLDTANQCHLGCPSCVNSYDRDFAERTFNVWPRGLMTQETFDHIAAKAIYLFSAHFYNAHEPLLNKLTPVFVRQAYDRRVRTFISSNMSYQRIDAEAIVASGLTELMVACDGATQASYERYRQGGKLEFVLGCARSIAEEKRRARSATPILRWQFLTFEHNVHEVDRAIDLARAIGFDSFNLATPYVEGHGSQLKAVAYDGPEDRRAVQFSAPPQSVFYGAPDLELGPIEAAISESALDRWMHETGGHVEGAQGSDRCDWLHLATISDALGRTISCCNGDYRHLGRMVFGDVGADNIMNSSDYQAARRVVMLDEQSDVVCARCPVRSRPQVGLGAVAAYFSELPEMANLRCCLHDWSRHTALA